MTINLSFLPLKPTHVNTITREKKTLCHICVSIFKFLHSLMVQGELACIRGNLRLSLGCQKQDDSLCGQSHRYYVYYLLLLIYH